MKRFYGLIFILSVCGRSVFAQVGINTEHPNEWTALDIRHIVSDNKTDTVYKRVCVPSLTSAQRDDFPTAELPDNFLIYNTDEECFNFYSAGWKSLCGLVESQASMDCSNIRIYGTYRKNIPLTPAEYVLVEVNVTETGSYAITAESFEADGMTPAGYYACRSGEFLSTGAQTVLLDGVGVPAKSTKEQEGTNVIKITFNNTDACSGATMLVGDPAMRAVYAVDCDHVTVKGEYIAGQKLTAKHYLEILIVVDESSVGASYRVATDTVNGYYFLKEGILPAPGTHALKIYGYGTPFINQQDEFSIRFNNTAASECRAAISQTVQNIKILTIGGNLDNPGDNVTDETLKMRLILDNSAIFGKSPDAKCKVEGFAYFHVSGTVSELKNGINAIQPDIILYSGVPYKNDSVVSLLTGFVDQGGSLIFSTYHTDADWCVQSILGNSLITASYSIGATAFSPLIDTKADILRKPYNLFAEGADAGLSTNSSTGLNAEYLPLQDVIIVAMAAVSGQQRYVRAILHRTKSFFLCLDAQTFSNSNLQQSSGEPLNTNAKLFVNVMADAIRKVQKRRLSGNEKIIIP